MSNITGALRPLGDRVLVRPDVESEDKTKSGLIIPDAAKESPLTGTVDVVGPGRQLKDGSVVPMSLKPGDKVYYSKFAGIDVKVDGTDLLLIHEDEIYAIVE